MKSQGSKKPKILVVDDEPDNLDLLYRTFHRDYKVLRADNGPAALEILASEGDVAVIISDQRMPLMSGTEFLSLTATQYPDIIRIILTGYTDVEDLVEAINAGKVFKYVTKPWDAAELKALVQQAMDTHNVLKVRTEELCRTLRRESLLNTVTNTIRNAQYRGGGGSPLRQVLQTIVETVGHMLEVSVCILRPFQEDQMADEGFIYQRQEANGKRRLSGLLTSGLKPEAQGKSEDLGARTLEEYASASSVLIPASFSSLDSHREQQDEDTDSGLGQLVWETQDVEVINDVETDERLSAHTPEIRQRLEAMRKQDIHSSLVVPLYCQLELMAVMALHQCGEPRAWQDDEIQLVVMVADQAALALSQARAYEQVSYLARREALVNTITTAIRSSLDPQDIFAAITQQLGQALQVDGCALSLWREEDEFVQCVGLYDGTEIRVMDDAMGAESVIELQKPEFLTYNSRLFTGTASTNQNSKHEAKNSQLPQSVVPIAGNPVLQQLLSTQQPVVIDDLGQQPEMNGFDLPLRSPARALLVVPLLSDGRIIGSITLRQTHKSRRWHASEIELAQAVAAQAAIAVQQSRLYQKTRQQAERLLELDRQKTEFFQNVSHEFRTPLTLMLGPLESAVNQHQDLPYEQAAIALRNSRRLLRLVNQLLDIQRLDAGKMQASFRPCNLVEFVETIVEAFRPYCEKKGLNLLTYTSPCLPVYLDLERFDKVLYNLLSNAMKFTPVGGTITVTVESAGDHVRVQIADTGIGIRPEQIPHLFERFRQAEGSVNRSYEGSGLGLALVKELVELHGGQISIGSVYTEGSTFTVWLQTGTAHLPLDQVLEVPTEVQFNRAAVELADLEIEEEALESEELIVNAEELKESSTPNPSLLTHHSSHISSILVVDDNPDLRTYVSRILLNEGYQVWTARNGDEGFTVTKNRRPDLIVTDLMMPLVSGLDMIRMIREQEELKGTPIILLTAKVDEETRIEGTSRGADAYLAKPFNDRELLSSVRNLLALKENERRVLELNSYLTESVLKRFLPPSMVQKAARGELKLDLSPEPKLITVLFSDIVGFTQLANNLRSRKVAELLNEYLEAMTKAVFDNGGTVDKFVGDAVLALFGAPEELTPNEQVRRAIASARQMHASLELLNQKWIEDGLVGTNGRNPVQFRCGIHQGTAVVGMFGGAERSDYTAVGPSVNIASRLQEAAQPNSILVSAAVADYLDEDEMTKQSPLTLKGIDETVLSFAVNPQKSPEA
ncbi:response regulator [Funiculus sociatus]|nr:response regulator [Trichocoleus sp. FACHB-69]